VPHSVDELNRIANPRLAEGRSTPRGWRWTERGAGHSWRRHAGDNGDAPVMTVRSDRTGGYAGWARRVRCKPGDYYRVEMVVSGRCRPAAEGAGLVLALQPFRDERPCGHGHELLAPPELPEPAILRAYFHAPEGCRWAELRVGLRNAGGEVCIHEVLMLPILDPEAKSHVHAAPPHRYGCPPPRRVRSVCVCTAAAQPRPIATLLAGALGRRAVSSVAPSALRGGSVDTDAVFFPDPTPPAAVSTMPRLLELAERHLVVLSLPAFARLRGRTADTRTVIQPDDPIHAKVHFATFATHGLAIADVFPWAWRGADRRTFVQRHLRRGADLRAFCKEHGFEILLESVCETDATSGHPVCLYKETTGGGIFVLDVEPAESVATNFDEPDLAMYLLRNILGVDQNALGQYVTAARSAKAFRDEILELRQRYPAAVVTGEDHPDKPRRDQLVQVGCAEQGLGLPLVPRPLILIRTGLRGDDTDGVYGAMFWLKSLVRPEPFACPFAEELVSRFRFAWVPLLADWHAGQGWRRPREVGTFDHDWDFEPGTLAAVIDLTSTPLNRIRVVVSDKQARRRYAGALPELARACLDGRYYCRSVAPGRPVGDRAAMTWRRQRPALEVAPDREALFDTDLHQRAAAAGAVSVRLELPGPADDLTTSSIRRTDWAASLLEHIVGLQYGWLVMNRFARPLRVTPPREGLAPEGRILSMEGSRVVCVTKRLAGNGRITVPAGAALCIPRA